VSLATLGIIFGDIGTSPLYTLRRCSTSPGSNPDAAAILGSLSLILWTLFLITSVKYVN
jgi:KUP system potassium uptake protein